jgi:hypothetical protein
MFTQHVDKNALKSHWLNKLSLMLDGGLTFRESNPDQIMDVKFNDFMKDENKVVSEIMTRMLSGDPKTTKVEENNKNYMSNHRYQLEDWEIKPDELNTRFVSYKKLVEGLND